MAIGHRVRAADEAKQRITLDSLNEGADTPDEEPVSVVTRVPAKPKAVFGALAAADVQRLVAKGLSISDVRALAETGMTTAEIDAIADAQSAAVASSGGSVEAFQAIQAQNAQMMEKVLERARNRRPESYNGDFPFPNISAFNPDGDAKPAPKLKCEMWEGVLNKDGKPGKGHPLEQGDLGPLTKREVRCLNLLQRGVYTIINRDEEPGKVQVHIEEDANGAPTLLIIVYPQSWMSKEGKNKKPSVVEVCRQIFGVEGNIDRWLDEKDAEAVAA